MPLIVVPLLNEPPASSAAGEWGCVSAPRVKIMGNRTSARRMARGSVREDGGWGGRRALYGVRPGRHVGCGSVDRTRTAEGTMSESKQMDPNPREMAYP